MSKDADKFKVYTLQDEAELLGAARALVRRARQLRLVLTIEQVPLHPLAMGNYETLVGVRVARIKAKQEFRLEPTEQPTKVST